MTLLPTALARLDGALQQACTGLNRRHILVIKRCSPSRHAGLFVETVHPVYGGVSKDGRRRRQGGLKRLDFVRAYSEYYWAKANSMAAAVYANSRALMPAALEGSLRAVEDKVSELGQPLLAAVQTRSEQVLTSLDRKARPLFPSLAPLPAVSLLLVVVGTRGARHPQGGRAALLGLVFRHISWAAAGWSASPRQSAVQPRGGNTCL